MTAGEVTPPLTPQQLAAVMAAVELVWPRPAPAPAAPVNPEPAAATSWRFSGRWWAQAKSGWATST
ncbi:MAG TPA: hypothetical protein VMZ51_06100 [Acidimicrobiales bacterium]|nr:hypothetical protein [Acidimicrobiales bacterium]